MAYTLIRAYDTSLTEQVAPEANQYLLVDKSGYSSARRMDVSRLLWANGNNPGATASIQTFLLGIQIGNPAIGLWTPTGFSLNDDIPIQFTSGQLVGEEAGVRLDGLSGKKVFLSVDGSSKLDVSEEGLKAYEELDMNGNKIRNLAVAVDGGDALSRAAGDARYAPLVHTHPYEPANPNIQAHINNFNNPHNVTVAQIGAAPANHHHDDTYALLDHAHSGYAVVGHHHNELYAVIDHHHDDVYAVIDHHHDERYALLGHHHNTLYAAIDHHHNALYAAISHHHDGVYAAVGHNHDDAYASVNHHHNDLYAQLGHTHSGSDITSGTVPVQRLPIMVGATSSANGIAGLVPTPLVGEQDKALFGDGTWRAVNTGGDMFKAVYDTDNNGYVDYATGLRTGAGTNLAVGSVADGELLVRSGSNIVGLSQSTFAAANHGHSGYQPLDTGLTNLANLTGSGILVATATDSWALRVLTAGEGIGVSNGSGADDNPTVGLAINGLTALTSPNANEDYVVIWSASVGGHRKVLLSNLPASGEANTGNNLGTVGVGVFDSKSGVTLQFRRIAAKSNRVDVSHNTTDNRIEIDVDEGNLNLGNMGGSIDLGSSRASGTLAAARFPALTGDVTTTAGSVATTIANGVVTNAKLAAMAANTIKGNATGSSAAPTDIALSANQFLARKSTGNISAWPITDFAFTLLDDGSAADARSTLGLGTAAVQNIGSLNGEWNFSGANMRLPYADGGFSLSSNGAIGIKGNTKQIQFYAGEQLIVSPLQAMVIAMSDESTNLTTGVKVTFRVPFAMKLPVVPRASVNTAPSGGPIEIDIKVNGTSIFSTRLRIDNGSKTSVGSSTTPVLSTTTIADDAEVTLEVTSVPSTPGKGLKLTIYYYVNA